MLFIVYFVQFHSKINHTAGISLIFPAVRNLVFKSFFTKKKNIFLHCQNRGQNHTYTCIYSCSHIICPVPCPGRNPSPESDYYKYYSIHKIKKSLIHCYFWWIIHFKLNLSSLYNPPYESNSWTYKIINLLNILKAWITYSHRAVNVHFYVPNNFYWLSNKSLQKRSCEIF